MTDIVIEIRGGALTEVYSDRRDLRVTIVDWDSVDAGEGRGGVGTIPYASLKQMDAKTAKIVRQRHRK